MTSETFERSTTAPMASFLKSKHAPAIFAALGVLLLLIHRNSTLFFHPQLWAEDLIVYFVEDRLYGAEAILRPYAGYVQLACRLIAYAAGFFAVEIIPTVYAWAFVASIFATATIVYTSPSFTGWGKPLATIALIAAPVSSEVFYGMCYEHWVLAPLVALALHETPSKRWRMFLLGGGFALVGFSSPFTIIAAPFVLIKVAAERSTFAFSLAAITAANAAFHLKDMMGRAAIAGGPDALDRFLTVKTFFYSWAIRGGQGNIAAMVGISILTAAFLIWYFYSTRQVENRTKLYLLGYGSAMLIVGCLACDPSMTPNQFGAGGRYFYLPAVTFIWAVTIIEQGGARRRNALAFIASVMAFSYIANVRGDAGNYRDTGWEKTIECLRVEWECTALINPAFLGTFKIPTDRQIRSR